MIYIYREGFPSSSPKKRLLLAWSFRACRLSLPRMPPPASLFHAAFWYGYRMLLDIPAPSLLFTSHVSTDLIYSRIYVIWDIFLMIFLSSFFSLLFRGFPSSLLPYIFQVTVITVSHVICFSDIVRFSSFLSAFFTDTWHALPSLRRWATWIYFSLSFFFFSTCRYSQQLSILSSFLLQPQSLFNFHDVR